jgi:hypothetical protein
MFIKNQIVNKITRDLSGLTVPFFNNRTKLILNKSTLKIDGCKKVMGQQLLFFLYNILVKAHERNVS